MGVLKVKTEEGFVPVNGLAANDLVATQAELNDEGVAEFKNSKGVAIFSLDLSGNEPAEMYVDVAAYGIIAGDFGHGAPYSTEEYEIAYKNLLGIKTALTELAEQGYSAIKLPKGVYPVCYQNPNGGDFNANTGWEIIIPSHVDIDLCGSTIKVIYDSDNKNPYDKSTLAAYQLNGKVFCFSGSRYSSIRNGILLGDRYERSFSNGSEKNQEQTYGIYITNGSEHCEIADMEISGFMGDAVSGNANHDPVNGGSASGSKTFTNVYIDKNSGNEVTANVGTHVFTSDYQDISGIVLKGNTQMVLRTNIGYAYEFTSDYYFIVYFYDADKVYLSCNQYEQLDNIQIPNGAHYCRISHIASAFAGNTTQDFTFQLTTPSSQFFVVKNCKIYNNNRGGLSNLPHDITIEKCELFENGTAGTEGFPIFGDTTRYAINCEDTVCRKIVIKDNYIHDGFNGILMSAKYCLMDGNVMKNFISSLSVYNGRDNIVTNNKFENVKSPNFQNDNAARRIVVTNNFFKYCDVAFDDRIVFQNNVYIPSGNISFNSTSDMPISLGNVTETLDFVGVIEQWKPIRGLFENCVFNCIRPQYSTSFTIIDMDKRSRNVSIKFGDTGRRFLPWNVYNATLTGGFGVVDSNNSQGTEFNIHNSEFSPTIGLTTRFYGSGRISKWYLSDTHINIGSDFVPDCFFNFVSNNSYTTGDAEVVVELSNCTIDVHKDAVFEFIRVGFSGKPAKVNLVIKNCVFNNHTDKTMSIANVLTDLADYTLTFEGNTLNGNWTEPTAPVAEA